jgi:hypothetical protein
MKFEPCKEFVYCPYCPEKAYLKEYKAYLKEYNRVGYIRVNGIRTNDIFNYISYKYECDICSRKYTTTESDELSQYNYISREKSQKRNNKINKIWE